MVDIDPLNLIKTTYLRCFGEVFQDKLVRFLKTFLALGEYEGASPSSISQMLLQSPTEGRERGSGGRAPD